MIPTILFITTEKAFVIYLSHNIRDRQKTVRLINRSLSVLTAVQIAGVVYFIQGASSLQPIAAMIVAIVAVTRRFAPSPCSTAASRTR